MKTTPDRRLAKLSDELNIPYYLESKWGVRHLIISWGWITRVAEEGTAKFRRALILYGDWDFDLKAVRPDHTANVHAANQAAISFPT